MNIVLNRSLTGVFCEDIRHEIQGKQTLVGCFSGAIEVSEFPATLPKLCIHVILQTPAEQPFRSVKLIVLKDDLMIAEGDLVEVPEGPSPEIEHQLQRMDAQFVFSPFAIEKPCAVRVRALADGEELRGLALEIRKGSGGEELSS